jgi:thiamine pyrophosphate-dependent acetolactate synthase large subunit-like protein
MALGFAQATGQPGIYGCVSGPGFLNTTGALSTAYACHALVLALFGQVATERSAPATASCTSFLIRPRSFVG